MKVVSVSGSPRENVGKKDARRLRREGLIPCVLYGGKEQIQFFTPEVSFKDIVYTPEACLLNLEIDGKTYDVVLQDIQFHPVSDAILHVDFLQIFPDKPVKVDIPITMVGTSPGVIKGGKLQVKLRKLKVRALPADLPDTIEVSIAKLNIGDTFKVGQLSLENVEFLDPEHAVVVLIKSARAAMAAFGDEEEEETTEAVEGAEGAEGTEGTAEGGEGAAEAEKSE